MKITLKGFKTLKIKDIFKTQKLIFIFNSTNKKDWIKVEQVLTGLKVNFYKINKNTFYNAFRDSIYENANLLIKGVTIIIQFNLTILKNMIEKIKKHLSILGIKFNKSYYSIPQLALTNYFNFKDVNLALIQTLMKNLKTLKQVISKQCELNT